MGRSLGSPLDGHAALKDLGRIVSEMSNMKAMMREMARSARLKQQEDIIAGTSARAGAGEARICHAQRRQADRRPARVPREPGIEAPRAAPGDMEEGAAEGGAGTARGPEARVAAARAAHFESIPY